MNVTNNLKLPQYTGEDIFDLQDINKAYGNIDKAYGDIDDARKEVVNIKDEIPKTNATAEVISARGGKETLGKRLDEFGSQLDTKANQNEVRFKNVELDLNDFNESSRNALVGGDKNLNYTFGKGSVKTVNISEKQITPTKLTGISIGKNIYHKYNATIGKYITTVGTEGILENYLISDYQEKIPNADFTVSSYGGEVIVAYYNSNYEYQSQDKLTATNALNGVTLNNEYPIFRLSHNKTTPKVMVEYGSVKTTYEDFYYCFDNNLKIQELNKINSEIEAIKEEIKPPTYSGFNDNKEPYDYDLAYIYDNKLFGNANPNRNSAKYSCVILNDKPNKIMAKVIFTEGTVKGSFDLISNPNGTNGAIDICTSSVHIVFMGDCVQIGVWIIEDGKKVLKILSAPKYSINLDGITEYEIGWELNGNVLTVYKPDGTTYQETNDWFVECNGKYVTFEHYYGNSKTCRTIATKLEAYVNNELVFWDNFKRPDGLLDRSTSGHEYVLKKEI